MTAPNPYARDHYHGVLMDNATIAAVKLAEARLGYELTIIQGVGSAPASADTHKGLNGEGGRAIDIAWFDIDRKDKVLKDLGFVGWPRPYRPGVWGAHGHYLLVLENRENARGIAAAAFRQIGSWFRGRNGLSDDGPDAPGAYRPTPFRGFTLAEYAKTFEKPPVRPARNNVTRARDRLVEAITAAEQAEALLDDALPSRVKVKKELEDVRRARRALQASLADLPRR